MVRNVMQLCRRLAVRSYGFGWLFDHGVGVVYCWCLLYSSTGTVPGSPLSVFYCFVKIIMPMAWVRQHQLHTQSPASHSPKFKPLNLTPPTRPQKISMNPNHRPAAIRPLGCVSQDAHLPSWTTLSVPRKAKPMIQIRFILGLSTGYSVSLGIIQCVSMYCMYMCIEYTYTYSTHVALGPLSPSRPHLAPGQEKQRREKITGNVVVASSFCLGRESRRCFVFGRQTAVCLGKLAVPSCLPIRATLASNMPSKRRLIRLTAAVARKTDNHPGK